MKNARMTICLVAAVLTIATGQGFGLTQFKDGGTHNINSTTNDDVWVDYLAPGKQTTVNLLNGGYIPQPYKLQGYNDSRINISGGSVGYFMYANERSQITMSSGSMGYLYGYGNSQVTKSGGSVTYFNAYDSSRVTMSGGSTLILSTRNSSQVTMSGGSRVSDLYALNSSQITMSGGSVYNYFDAEDNSKISWSGGTITGVGLDLRTAATLTIYGSNFALDGTPVGPGEITSMLGGDFSNEPYRTLTGTLANGDIINNQFRIGNDASIVIVPEPATLFLLTLGGLAFRRKK
jgi:hypothetical protein